MRPSIIPNELYPIIRKERELGTRNIDLCIKYGVSIKTIQRVTKGVPTPPLTQNKKKISPIEVYNKYKEIGSIEGVSRVYGKSATALKKMLKKAGYTWDTTKSARTHDFNTSYFNKIDTEEKAYWIGFLYADGAMHKGGCGINIRLQKRDKEHLELFAKSISYKGAIRYVSNSDCYELPIYSQEMHKDLTKQGCTIRKSFTITFPTEEQMPKELQRHFIRGYFDGDGCITNSKKQTFSIVGNWAFIEKLQENLIQEIGISKTKLYKHKGENCYSLVYGGCNMIMKIAQYLYKDATVFLERKKNKFKWL